MAGDYYLCPECGENRMVRRPDKDGRYTLHCESCGAERGPFRDSDDIGVA